MKTYYMLTKPGIILGNIITTAGGFALASHGSFDIKLFALTMIGLAFVIASAGVFNSFIDRQADAKMSRTKERPLVKGLISTQNALFFGFLLGIIGIGILATYTNALTVTVALIGFIVYLVLYAFVKYRSFYGTLVGSIAGATPPVVGYCAVSNQFDTGAFLLFMILVLWQMPHFFSIAIYRLDDYVAASIPVMPIVKGMKVTKMHMALYIIAFTLTTLLLTLFEYTSYFYGAIAALLGIAWLAFCINGFFVNKDDDKIWARKMFVYSLVVMMTLCAIIPFDIATPAKSSSNDWVKILSAKI